MTGLVTTAGRPVRMAWRRLTSMRTALILLFLLAVAAVPGSLLPQRPLNASKTKAYIAAHGVWGRFLDRIGMFDVFGSVWFAAIYLLLFVSLVGCLVPRIRVHARAMARKPLPAPRHLDRLPESASFETGGSPEQYAAAARAALGRRWRVARRQEPSGAVTLSAEKGYSRETGNLLFHVSLLVALVLIAVGRLYSYEGSRIVLQGANQGFCNTVSQYDSWKPGRFAAEGQVAPARFCLDMPKFTAAYTPSGEAKQFTANVDYEQPYDAPPRTDTISVNHPLRIAGDRVYLTGHGYAPRVTITMPDGSVVHDTEAFIPSDATTLQSEGAFKKQGPDGADKDVGIAATFSPTPVLQTAQTYTSASPKVDHPVLGIAVYVGDLNYNGLPQSVYSLDTTKMRMLGAANLRIGQTKHFPDGVSVRFDGWLPWANFQVSHDPTQGWLLLVAVTMVVGLLGSLGVRRRRLWLRLTPSGDGPDSSRTVVEVGGLARSDSGNFGAEFARQVERLQAAGRAPQEQLVGAGTE